MIPALQQAWCSMGSMLAQAEPSSLGIPEPGGYLSVFKIAGMLILVLPWLKASTWVSHDSHSIRASRAMWGSVMLGVGGAVFLVWLLVPNYVIGLVLYTLAVAILLGSYLSYRNARVPEEERLTLASLLSKHHGRPKEKVIVRLKLYGARNKIMQPPADDGTGDAEAIHAFNLVQDLLYDMVWRRASEADMSPAGEESRVRFMIDGVTVERPSRTLGESESIIQYLKEAAAMAVDDRRKPQKGKISIDLLGKQTEITITSAGTTGGQRMHFRVVSEFVKTQLDTLGMSPQMLEEIRKLTLAPNGLFIVSGSQGSGVTSTIYSLLREQDAFIKQLVTLEAKEVVDLENITQIKYETPDKLAHNLASAIRRDPDVIMIDQCSDAASAELIWGAAAKKFILLGMPASETFSALAKWLTFCGGKVDAIQNLRGLSCQMLVRKLCPECREAYTPDPLQLAKANIPAEEVDVFYRPTGKITNEKGKSFPCHNCQGSGYFGRMAVFELLEFNNELKKLVMSGASMTKVKSAARKNGMVYLQEQAFAKVISGETSIEEIIRVSRKKEKTK